MSMIHNECSQTGSRRTSHSQKVITLILLLTLAVMAACSGGRGEGPRPEDFSYDPLVFSPPDQADYRTQLSNGLVVYIAEDHEIPWFSASLMMKTGPFLEPANKLGVASLTARIMRTGGTGTKTGEEIDERMDFLAGSVSATSLSVHQRDVEEGINLWMEILTDPAFPEDKLRRQKESALVGIQNRNKNVSQVGRRAFNELVYGEDSPITADQTEAIVNGLVRRDLVNWHRKYWGANNAILIVSGDFDRAEMLARLEETFGRWADAEKAVPRIPDVEQAATGGVYMIEPEVVPNQGVIQIGHIGLMQDDPDKIVRSDNGLAYSTGSRFSGGTLYPGTFAASCQTKNSTVVFAAQLMLNEIEKIRSEQVSEEDLEFARTARISAFPAQFSSISRIIRNFANLEFNGRSMDYYSTYEERYAAVTLDDISRVANKYLNPDRMIIMISGNIEECRAGADRMLPNQQTIDDMAAAFGGRTIDGLAEKYGDGEVHILRLK